MTSADVAVLKGLAKPPALVKEVTAVVCMLLGIAPAIKGQGPEKTKDYWGPSVKMMRDKNFLKTLLNFDVDSLDPKVV